MRQTIVRVSGLLIFVLMSVRLAIGYDAIAVQNSGTIVGTVTYSGELPTPEKVEISKDQEICGKTEKVDEKLLVGKNRGLQNVVVSIVDIAKGKAFEEATAVLDQQNCRYTPHVVLVPKEKPLRILNNDGILHSVRTHSSKNPAFHKAQSKFKKEMFETFGQSEFIQVSCDVHSWMSGWIVVQEHPYFVVTNESGEFRLTQVPVGTYRLRFQHGILGEQFFDVTVTADQSVRSDISFGVKK